MDDTRSTPETATDAARTTLRAHDTHSTNRFVRIDLRHHAGVWAVGPTNVDGYPLDRTDGGTTNSDCDCGDPHACEAARVSVDNEPGPTGTDLIGLLARAAAGMYDAFGPDATSMPHLADTAGPWVELRDALRADDSELSRRTLAMLFGE